MSGELAKEEGLGLRVGSAMASDLWATRQSFSLLAFLGSVY